MFMNYGDISDTDFTYLESWVETSYCVSFAEMKALINSSMPNDVAMLQYSRPSVVQIESHGKLSFKHL